jgi:hypothetical protein
MTDNKYNLKRKLKIKKYNLESKELIFTQKFTNVTIPINLQFTAYIITPQSQFPVTVTVIGTCENPVLLISFLALTTYFPFSTPGTCTTGTIVGVPEGLTVDVTLSNIPILGVKGSGNNNNCSSSSSLVGSSTPFFLLSEFEHKKMKEKEKENVIRKEDNNFLCVQTNQILTGTAVVAPIPNITIEAISQSILQSIFAIPNATCLSLRQGDPSYPASLAALTGLLGIDPLSTLAQTFAALIPLFLPLVSGEISRLLSVANLIPIQIEHSALSKIKICSDGDYECGKFIKTEPLSIFLNSNELARKINLILNSTCRIFQQGFGQTVFPTTIQNFLEFLPPQCKNSDNNNNLNLFEIPDIGCATYIPEMPCQTFSPALLVTNELEIIKIKLC